MSDSLPPAPPDPAAEVPFDSDEAVNRAVKRVVRTAVGQRIGSVAVARIAAGLVQTVMVLRDEMAADPASFRVVEPSAETKLAGLREWLDADIGYCVEARDGAVERDNFAHAAEMNARAKALRLVRDRLDAQGGDA